MHHRSRLILRGGHTLAVALAFLGTKFPARGAVIFTGTGASAQASYTAGAGADMTSVSQQKGSNPAVAGGTENLSYFSTRLWDNTSVIGTQQATGSATPGQATLLRISTSFSSNPSDPGPMSGAINPSPSVSAQANWNLVQARVSGQDGQESPSSIRLEFQLNYQSPFSIDRFSPGGNSWYIPGYMAQALSVTTGGLITLAEAGTPMQAGESAVQAQPDGSLSGTFHIDLGLSPSGVSNLFSMGLSSYLEIPEILFQRAGNVNESMSLSLLGVDMPDGTPVSDAGYNITFESGVYIPPPPAPEPGAVVIWGVLAMAGATMLRRRRAA